MEMRQETRGTATVLWLQGHLDEMAASEVEAVFAGLAEADRVVVDMSGVEYINSGGLRLFLMLSKSLGGRTGGLKLCNLSPFVAEVFEISHFVTLFDIYPSLEAALDAPPASA